jgi:hypothetical protein
MPSQNMIETTLIEQAAPQIAKGEKDFIDLESVELELALNLETLRELGFEECLREASKSSGFNFLFQLPVFDQNPGQRIAVMSTEDGDKLLYAVLDNSGTEIEIVPEEAMRSEIRNFAAAFMDVFSQLGSALS